jgi:hypothetical protein
MVMMVSMTVTVVIVVVLVAVAPEIVHSVVWIAEVLLLISSDVTSMTVVEIAVWTMLMSVMVTVVLIDTLRIEMLWIPELGRRWIMRAWSVTAAIVMLIALTFTFVFVPVVMMFVLFSL